MHYMNSKLKQRPFHRDDFAAFQSWFADQLLQDTLGPLDEEWLNCVLSEDPPAQFSFFADNHLVAVAGISFPEIENPCFAITDLAVHPDQRRSGIGAHVVQLLQKHFRETFDSDIPWKAFVSLGNSAAQKFFTNLGWVKQPEIEDEMYCYVSP